MRFKEEPEDPCEIQMGPMMDCVFLLLLYFISASQIKVDEKYLGLMIPGTVTATKDLVPELTLSINENGQVFCNEQPLANPDDRDLTMVRAKISQCMSLFGDKQPVVIHPQPQVRQQRIVDVLNACAAVGVKNLSFFANQ
ncbi:MAG: biopolymer transporter ExbD [Verrucomicrobia bacterium]|nr:biopolymer transporter ExbD [Verrucomicrobiota bacterium]MBU4289503.1 biopolymer transporter ExbD [Verrucomicrobiota bacterium]MBU4428336.1 biopolymer transporter ExbD [Verrucomicrobiota bacterium]MBU4496390.1 biopolymer transporter ExbD [Verrucomicrobiota bacterium]MCG2678778.1 biopolymer transporter ExbD [Kiritimatiellia bacterium]